MTGSARVRRVATFSTEQVRAVLKDLVATLHAVTVDEIDGEFYWRCCRGDLSRPIAEFVASERALIPPGSGESRVLFEYAAAALQFAGAARRLKSELLERYPQVILDYLLAGKHVPLRAPEVMVHTEWGELSFRMNVYSGSWTGKEVERAFWAGIQAIRQNPAWSSVTGTATGAESKGNELSSQAVLGSTAITFRLVTDPAQVDVGGGGPVRVPFIEIVAFRVLPDPGDLATAYDRKARDRDQLHLKLPGTVSRQEKETALRTWTLGLLIKSGAKFTDALRQVTDILPSLEVSQTRFIQDRQNLLTRVPEAAPYLYVRNKRPSPLSKGD